jgi:hypothetical protein
MYAWWRALLPATAIASLLGCSRRPGPQGNTTTSADASPAGTLTEARRQRLVSALLPLVEAHYVSRELGVSAAAAVREHTARGDYANLAREEDLARRLTDDLRAVTNDLHFRVRYRPAGWTEPTTPEREAELAVEARHGIASVEHLPGGVALLKIDSFLEPPDTPALLQAYAAAMSEVADAPALLLDLRDNYGGDPATVAFAMSYFFDPTPVHLNDIWSREEDVMWQNWTRRDLPGKRFGGHKPVVVLVSKRTISGGEEAAYDLQTQKRALVLGEPTAGAANPAPPFDLGDGFNVFVPVARAINPITQTNWEGKGVIPDVSVAPPDAVKLALSMASDAGGR